MLSPSVRRALAVRSLLLALALLGATAAPGCLFAPRVRELRPAERPYAGPPISVTERDGKHLIVLQAPSTGYAFELDGRRGAVEGSNLFVTVRRPDPRFLYTQQIVEQRLLTPVRTTETVRVYARVIDFDDRSNEREFGFVTEHAGTPDGP